MVKVNQLGVTGYLDKLLLILLVYLPTAMLLQNVIILCFQNDFILSSVIVTSNYTDNFRLNNLNNNISDKNLYNNNINMSSQNDSDNSNNSNQLDGQSRVRRDEFENVGRAFGRGMGYYLGEPCIKQCNAILFHIYCNLSTQRCECLPEYPVNLDNRICIKALKLGEKCDDNFSCQYNDKNAICSTENRCRCDYNHYPGISKTGETKCIPGLSIYYSLSNYSNIMPIITIIGAIILCSGVVCFGYRIIGKSHEDSTLPGRDNRPISPPPVKLGGLELLASLSRPPSLRSVSNDCLPTSRRPSYSMLAPPSNFISRRPSSSSGTSFRSYSSFRSQTSFRNYRGNYFGRETLKYNSPRTPSPVINPSNLFIGENSPKKPCAIHSNPEINRTNNRRDNERSLRR